MGTPTYDFFKSRARGGMSVRGFVGSLVEGEPVRLPEGINRESLKGMGYSFAKSKGFSISVRIVDGVTWVCRMKPEDAGE